MGMDQRMLYLALMVVPPLLSTLLCVILTFDWLGFTREVPVIRTPAEFHRFQRMASRSMYGAIVVLIALVISLGASAVGRATEALSRSDIAYLLLTAGVQIAVGLSTRGIERRARETPAEPNLQQQREYVAHVWEKEMLPKW